MYQPLPRDNKKLKTRKTETKNASEFVEQHIGIPQTMSQSILRDISPTDCTETIFISECDRLQGQVD